VGISKLLRDQRRRCGSWPGTEMETEGFYIQMTLGREGPNLRPYGHGTFPELGRSLYIEVLRCCLQ